MSIGKNSIHQHCATITDFATRVRAAQEKFIEEFGSPPTRIAASALSVSNISRLLPDDENENYKRYGFFSMSVVLNPDYDRRRGDFGRLYMPASDDPKVFLKAIIDYHLNGLIAEVDDGPEGGLLPEREFKLSNGSNKMTFEF